MKGSKRKKEVNFQIGLVKLVLGVCRELCDIKANELTNKDTERVDNLILERLLYISYIK